MKPIYLHVGTHKTGSTSIQQFLARADEVLAEQGFLYPRAGRPDTDWTDQYGQHKLYWSLVEKRGVSDDQVWHDLRREVEEHSADRILISAEGFSTIETEEIAQVLKYLRLHPVRILVYLRPPVQYVRSAYKQRVEAGTYSASFLRFVREMSSQPSQCNYLNLVSCWDQFDEVESIDIRLFDKVKEDPGLEASFADAVGIDFEGVLSYLAPPANTSPPDKLIQVARWINVAATIGNEKTMWRALMDRVRRNILGHRRPGRWLVRTVQPFLRDSLATDRASEILREELWESHRRFLEKYVPQDDWMYLRL